MRRLPVFIALFVTLMRPLPPGARAFRRARSGAEVDERLPGQAHSDGRARRDPGFERPWRDQGAGQLRRLYGLLRGRARRQPGKAWILIEKTLPLPFEDQWIVIRALAYSGLPDWKDLMRALALRIPERQVMIQKFLDGDLPALNRVSLEPHAAGRQAETVLHRPDVLGRSHAGKTADHVPILA